MSQLEHYQTIFNDLQETVLAHEPDWLKALRREGMDQFRTLGIPTTKDEEWRFTNVAPIARIPFFPPDPTERLSLQEKALKTLLSEKSPCQIVFVNGVFSRELTSLSSLPKGISVKSLAESVADDQVKYHLGRYVPIRENAFAAMNTAFMKDGAYIFVNNGVQLDTPVELLFISDFTQEHRAYFPRNLIVLGKGARVTVIENYVSASPVQYFTNGVTEIRVGEDSRLEHCKMQQENDQAFHITTSQIVQDRTSSYSSTSFSNGAALARNDLNNVLDGEGANSQLNGLYVTKGQQHVDNHTSIDHAKRHCTSQELYKGILAGKSRGIFNGRIIVRKEAQLTDARQTNKNLLITDGAQVNTKPQLQILADDVKCTHGATIGQLDPLAIFYMNTRGVSRETAQSLLTYGFATEVIAEMKNAELQERLSQKIMATLQAALFASRTAQQLPRTDLAGSTMSESSS